MPHAPSTTTGPVTAADLTQVARTLASRRGDWAPALCFTPDRRWYARLAAGEGWEAWLLTWLPGQGTGLHDHGGSSGTFVVLGGTLTESFLVGAPVADARPRLLTRRLAQGEDRSFDARHVHDLCNSGHEPAVSLHVYGPALASMTRYRLADDRLLVSSVERTGTDW